MNESDTKASHKLQAIYAVNMEVIGRRGLADTNGIFCKHCGDENKRVPANGLCRECEEHMCIACFGNHKRYKVCNNHIMVDIETKIEPKSDREEDTFVPCPKHIKEQVKFYCKCHDDVGCGDCMILYHKSCKVDYIADLSSVFSESKEFEDTVQHVGACQTEINDCFESMQNNNKQVDDMYQAFCSEIKSFRDELLLKLDKQEAVLLEKAEDIHRGDKHCLASIESECKELKDNVAKIHKSISSNCSETNLFINTIESKRAIREIQLKLSKVKCKNTISKYNFKRNDEIEGLLEDFKLGEIHLITDDKTPSANSQDCKGYEQPVTSSGTQAVEKNENEDNVTSRDDGYEKSTVSLPIPPADNDAVCQDNKPQEDLISSGYEKPITSKEVCGKSNNVYEANLPRTETQEYEDLIYEEIPQSKITRRRSSSRRKSWSLFENQMRCENILMAGEIVSFKDNNKGGMGLFVGKKSIKAKIYFEVEIINTTDKGNISIGFVPKDYTSNEQPGDGRFSMGYHTVDGSIHCDSAPNKRISPPCKIGDVIGIGVSSYLTNVFKTSISIFVTRNSQKIGSMDINNPSFCKLYPAVGLKAIDDKCRVVMDAELP